MIKTIGLSIFIIIFILQSHPLWLSIYVISIILLSLMSIQDFKTFHWFSYILCIVFLGGLLILFVYVSSLVPASTMPTFYISGLLIVMFISFYILIGESTSAFNNSSSFSISQITMEDKSHFIFLIIVFLSLILILIRSLRRIIKLPLRKL